METLLVLRPFSNVANGCTMLCPAVESIPGKVSGAWVLRGTRMPVSVIFENLEAGANIDDIMEWFEGLDREQIKAVIESAARSLDVAPSSAQPLMLVLFDQSTPVPIRTFLSKSTTTEVSREFAIQRYLSPLFSVRKSDTTTRSPRKPQR